MATLDDDNPYRSPPSDSVDRRHWPAVVRIGLWGLHSRREAWTFVWFASAGVVGCAFMGFVDPRFYIGAVAMSFAAMWYWLSLRWVDRNSRWSEKSPRAPHDRRGRTPQQDEG